MNKVHSIVWSEVHGKYVVASEKTKTRGKATSVSKAARTKAYIAAIALMGASGLHAQDIISATALPTGASVVTGIGSIGSVGSTMNIQQVDQKAIINWQTYNVGKDATVNYYQPSSTASVLNRVNSSDPSYIFGSINANGQVFITNGQGVVIGRSANLNVGAMVASTLNITDADFLANKLHFERQLEKIGAVKNEG